jgi:hypothetical protein
MKTIIRARIEFAVALLFTIAAASTAAWPSWIEAFTSLEPDRGSGAAERWIVLLLGLAAILAGLIGRRHYRIARAQTRSANPA